MRKALWLSVFVGFAFIANAQSFSAAQTMVNLMGSGPASSTGQVDLQVANMGGSDLDNVSVMIWALVKGQLVQLDNRKLGFIASGEFRQANNVGSPIKNGRIIICLTYSTGGARTETLEFYSNEHYTDPLLRDYGGRLQRFRSSASGPGLCSSMPQSAMQYLR